MPVEYRTGDPLIKSDRNRVYQSIPVSTLVRIDKGKWIEAGVELPCISLASIGRTPYSALFMGI